MCLWVCVASLNFSRFGSPSVTYLVRGAIEKPRDAFRGPHIHSTAVPLRMPFVAMSRGDQAKTVRFLRWIMLACAIVVANNAASVEAEFVKLSPDANPAAVGDGQDYATASMAALDGHVVLGTAHRTVLSLRFLQFRAFLLNIPVVVWR